MAAPARIKPHDPTKLKHWNTAKKMERDVVKSIKEDGLSPIEACIEAGITKQTYCKWVNWAIEDWEAGFTGTRLQDFIIAVQRADLSLKKRLNHAMWDKVEEGDARIMMYLADNRFGYAKQRKQTLELETKDDKGIEINIVNMTGVDADKEEAIEVDYEVNDGKRGDDSNSTEMD